MTKSQTEKVEKVTTSVLSEATMRSTIKDGKSVKVVANQSEALGVIAKELGGITEDIAKVILPFTKKGRALDTMYKFVKTLAYGPEEKTVAEKKAEVVAERDALRKENEALKRQLK